MLFLKLYTEIEEVSAAQTLPEVYFDHGLIQEFINSSVTAGGVGVLHNDQAELFVRCNHDLVLLRPDSYEGDDLFLVDLRDLALCLVEESRDDLAVIDGVILAHGRSDGEAFLVHDDKSDNTLMSINSVKSGFNLG